MRGCPLIVKQDDSDYHEGLNDSVIDTLMYGLERSMIDKVLLKSRARLLESIRPCIVRYRHVREILQFTVWR